MEFHESLMFPELTAPDRGAVFDAMGGAVIAAGHAREDYIDALHSREAAFPTGLPLSGGIAIPHTSAEYVSTNTIACATLTQPVTFGEMGGDPDSEIDVSMVFLLVVADGQRQVAVLSQLIKTLRDASFVECIRSASDSAAMARVLSTTLAG